MPAIKDDPIVEILEAEIPNLFDDDQLDRLSQRIREELVKPMATYIGDDFRVAERIVLNGF